MSYVDLIAMEAIYRNDKASYDNLMTSLQYSGKKEGFRQNDYSNNVFLATQMNADLQTSLLAMSNSLSPEAKQQYQLLAASKDLENHYTQLVGDTKTVSNMHYHRYIAWGLGALVMLIVLIRVPKD
jgi:hypothetical protein